MVMDLKKNPFCLSDADIKWVEKTLEQMTLEEKKIGRAHV